MGDIISAISGFSLHSGSGMVLLAEVLLVILPFFLPNAWVMKVGRAAGRALSIFLRQKIGVSPGEKVERYFQGTVAAFVDGLNEGLDVDDANGNGLKVVSKNP